MHGLCMLKQCLTVTHSINDSIMKLSTTTSESVIVTASSNQLCVVCNGSAQSCVAVYAQMRVY